MMIGGKEKLDKDVELLGLMAENMLTYIESSVLFYPIGALNPRLTLGAYLMRQYRLVALFDTLDDTQQSNVQAAMTQFHAALDQRVVRFEEKAHEELDARIRQWREYIRDLRSAPREAVNYATGVETRAMIEALFDKLSKYPYQLNPELTRRLREIDNGLRAIWKPGEFVWPPEWREAYPRLNFWWLYGRP